MYLRGGSIIPFGPAYQHVGEAKPNDDLSLFVALDENGKAEGVLFEDDDDGYEYSNGGYLLTKYVAELNSSVITVGISKTEGLRNRPRRRLHVHLLLGEGAMVDAWGTDGEDLHIGMPLESEVSKLVSASKNIYKIRMQTAKCVPDVDQASERKEIELSRTPVEIKSGEWDQIISMEHIPTGTQWFDSRVEMNGYEEYSGTDYRSDGCTEEYTVIDRDLEQAEKTEFLKMEGDIGGGLVIERNISISENDRKVFTIDSSIVARNICAGFGGYLRLVCLRIHSTFSLLHPTASYVSFTSINGSKHNVWPESGEQIYERDVRPNGEWMLVDKCLGLGLVNKFSIDQVYKCLLH